MSAEDPRARSSTVYIACIVLLLGCVALLGFQVRRLRDQPRFRVTGIDSRGMERLFSASLDSSDGKAVTLARLSAKYVVLFVFTTADCSACLPEMENLAHIEQARPDVRVFGILAYSNRDEARQTQESFGLSFPILLDPRGEVISSLRVPKTPWKIVINVPASEVVYQDPPSITREEREAFFQRVTRLGYF